MTIDELNIEIAADSEAANSGLQKLTATLEKFKKALPTESKLNKTRDAFKDLAEAFGTYNNTAKNVVESSKKIEKSVNSLISSTDDLTSATERNEKSDKKNLNIKQQFKKIKDIIKKAADAFGDFFNESNRYIESLNLFEVTMGDAAKTSLDFAENVSDAMGIDVSEWIEYQGTFQQLATGFGVASDSAAVMSQNLTQLSYDLASFFNVDTEVAADKLSSAIAGQVKGLREFGIDTSVAALQQYALENNINKTVSAMTQAEKTFLRYNLILEKSVNIQGDMARTLITPANSMRILSSQIVQLKRQIGNIVSVVAVKIIPIIQAVVRVVTEAAEKIAKLMGFELPKIDYSGLDTNGFTEDIEDAGDELDNATASAKEFKKQLMGFDELNIINENKQTASGGGSIKTDKLDFGVDDLKSYDFLSGMTKETDKWYNSIKGVADIIVEVAKQLWSCRTIIGIILGLLVLDKIVSFGKDVVDSISGIIKRIKDLRESQKGAESAMGKLATAAIVAATTITNAFLGKDFFKSISDGSITAMQAISDITGMATGLATAYAVGGPIGLAISGLGLLVGAVWGAWEAREEEIQKMVENSEEYKTVAANLDFVKEAVERSSKALKELDGQLEKYQELGMKHEDTKELVEQIYSIAGKADKSQQEMETLRTKIIEFNNLNLSDIKIEYDELSDKIVDSTTKQTVLKDTILETIDAYFKEAEIQGLKSALAKLTEEESTTQSEFNKALEKEKETKKVIADLDAEYSRLEREDLELYNRAFDEFGTLRAEVAGKEFDDINNRREAIKGEMKDIEAKKAKTEETYKLQKESTKELENNLLDITKREDEILSQIYEIEYGEKIATDAAGKYKEKLNEIGKLRFGDGWIDFQKQAEGSINDIRKMLGMIEIPTFVDSPKLKKSGLPYAPNFQGYATGGFPSAGQVFYAREDGVPEMVGRIGNRTAVANNDQITSAIANAVYNAIVAGGGFGSGNSQTNVTLELDGDVVARKVISYNNRQVVQTGASPLLV